VEKKDYDLVFMDIEMPEMDGVEATKRIRMLDSILPDIPVIAMTAHAMQGAREYFIESGMNDYICKPIDPDELLSAIRRQVRHGSGQTAEQSYTDNSVECKPDSDNITALTPDSISTAQPEAVIQHSVTILQKGAAIQNSGAILQPSGSQVDDSAGLLQIFNRDNFLDRVCGNEDILKQLVALIPKSMLDEIKNLKRALDSGNASDIRLCGHTIKGMAANFSADRIRDTAHKIELAGKAGDVDLAVLLAARLERNAAELKCVLLDMFPELFSSSV
ncbi:MAG: response regulator, partial [Desulfamplus sp.]|nr:response regulator [Desulfamplus sp.]